MSLNHTNQLFSRDLKHLVDPKYSAAPQPRPFSLATVLTGTAVLGVGIWLVAATFMALFSSSPPEVVAAQPQSGERAVRQEVTTQDGSSDASSSATPANQAVPEQDAAAGESPTGAPLPHGQGETLVWVDYNVKNGDSLTRIFKKHQLNTGDAIRIAEHKDAKAVRMLRPGQKLKIAHNKDNELRGLVLELRSNKQLTIGMTADGTLYFGERQPEYQTREKAVTATIDGSLFKTGAQAGLSDGLIMKLVNIYGWEIDFAREVKKGDRFTVVYEELFDGNTNKGTAEILAAEFRNQGRRLLAFRHVGEDGLQEYFDESGNNMRGTFLRTPMKISRITSGFSNNRTHPVLQEGRAHKGVDYAAPRGTPVLATSDGRVSFLGSKDGYGKTVVLKHGGEYATLYAHLSSFKSKLKPGSSVKQGQIIGFVGKTGNATAPHLHYEFQVSGVHQDPLNYEAPKGSPVPAAEKDKFLANAERWLEMMSQNNRIELAQTSIAKE